MVSIWASIPGIPAKKYIHSGYDPRKAVEWADIQLALVPDYVYRDEGNGDEVLPYLRLSIGSESVVLTEHQAGILLHELVSFRACPKWRGRKNMVRG